MNPEQERSEQEWLLLRRDLERTPTRVLQLLVKYRHEALSWRDVALLAAAAVVVQYCFLP